MNVHSSLIHYSLKLEQSEAYSYNGMHDYPAIGESKLLHTITWVDLIGIVLSEKDTREFILYNSIYMKFKNKQN